MRLLIILWAALVLGGSPACKSSTPARIASDTRSSGSVLLVGGGTTPPTVTRAMIAAAGGPDAPIVVLAQTEENAVEGAPESDALFRGQGAAHVEAPVGVPTAQVLALLEKARGVWIPGGDQNRF